MTNNNLSNSKLKNDYTPLLTVEKNNRYNCPVSHIVDTKEYRVDLDQDPCKALVYMNIGYDDLTDFDSPIYLSPVDAMDLANKLMNYATTAMANDNKGSFTNIFVEELRSEIKNKNVEWLSVYPVDLADQEYFTGCMILDVKYRTKDNSKELHFARILSYNFLMNNNRNLNNDLAVYLMEEYDISVIKFFTEAFNIKYNKMIELNKVNNIDSLSNLSNEDIERIKDDAFEELKNYNNISIPEDNNVFEE